MDANVNMLIISLKDMPNMLILSQRFPGPTPAKGAAVCDVLKLTSKLVLPLTTERLTTELDSSSPSRKRVLATEYAAELEEQCKTYCRSMSIATIPVMPAIAAGEDWATTMASWIVAASTNEQQAVGWTERRAATRSCHAEAVYRHAHMEPLSQEAGGGRVGRSHCSRG